MSVTQPTLEPSANDPQVVQAALKVASKEVGESQKRFRQTIVLFVPQLRRRFEEVIDSTERSRFRNSQQKRASDLDPANG